MTLKNAAAVCLISLVSATLVVLIARSLDLQAASRIEPKLDEILIELKSLRASGGIGEASDGATADVALDNGLIVYYFHGKMRCPTCRAIESQSHAAVQNDFAAELEEGKIAWKILNYEQPAGETLGKKFEVMQPVVVLARMKDGQIDKWKRLDAVWALVGDKPAFKKYIHEEIVEILGAVPPSDTPPDSEAPAIPVPDSTDPSDIPIPQ